MPLALDDVLSPAQTGAGNRPLELSLQEPVRRFPRLAEVAGNPDEALSLALTLTRDEAGWPRLEGTVHGVVELVCQRCLGPLRWPVDLELRLALVPEGAAQGVPPGFDAWEVAEEGEPMPRIRALVEDEILLSLPLVARHEERAECGELSALLSGATTVPEPAPREHPFAALRALKRDED